MQGLLNTLLGDFGAKSEQGRDTCGSSRAEVGDGDKTSLSKVFLIIDILQVPQAKIIKAKLAKYEDLLEGFYLPPYQQNLIRVDTNTVS